ncbi:MAG: peptide ABC transporter substrate-binding protein [Anaerolineaceae bacterium]|nr:peptide ABC transporter substrate-binding protein [Anaerolineaceae bacterium]
MKKLRWQLLIIFLTGLVVGILLINEKPEASSSVDVPEPQQGGVYSEALVGKFQRLNPVLDYYNSADRELNRLLFSRMITFEERGIPKLELVETYGISQDGTIYNITLRPDVKWHDGKALTTNDILFTINMIRDGEGVVPDDIRSFWTEVDVKTLSETTIQFRLQEPFAPFLDYLSFGILPEHLLGDLSFEQMIDSGFNLQPVGSGPYSFEGLITENNQIKGVILRANQNYFEEPPLIEQMVFRYYDNSSDALKAFQDGLVLGISKVEPTILREVLTNPDLALYTAREPRLTLIFFNLKNQEVPFFQDVNIRKALLSGLNRQKMVDKIFNSQAIIADGPILPGTWAYYDGIKSVEFDPTIATQLIKDAGYVLGGENSTIRTKDGVEFRFELLYPDDDTHRQMAEMIQQNWEALGTSVNIRGVSYSELINSYLNPRSYQAALIDLDLSWTPDPDPYPFWDQVQATGGQNYSQWDNFVASDYLEQSRITTNLIDRSLFYRNFQVVFEEELPALPLLYPVYNFAISTQIRGVSVGPMFDTSDRFLTVKNWFITGPRPENITTPSLENSSGGG